MGRSVEIMGLVLMDLLSIAGCFFCMSVHVFYLLRTGNGKLSILKPGTFSPFASVCVYEVSAVDKISDCHPGDPEFNPRPGRSFSIVRPGDVNNMVLSS